MTQVTVKYVNQPGEGKKLGNIKLSDDSIIGVPPAMLSKFQPGGTYDIEWSSRQWNGQEYRTVTKVTPVASANGAGGGHSVNVSKETAERIYVCGLLNSFAQGGQLQMTAEAIEQATKDCRQAWRNTFGNPQKAGDMDDEIPF